MPATTTRKGARWIDYLPVDDLVPDPRNTKGHVGAQIAASLERFGFTEPVMLDERTGMLIAGHGRREQILAARDHEHDDDCADGCTRGDIPEGIEVTRAGVWTVPVVRGWSSTDDAQALAYLIAGNQLTIAGGWERRDVLAAQLVELRDLPDGLDGVGFVSSDVDLMLADLARKMDPDPDPPTPASARKPKRRVKPGDLWQLGPHRLICGDSRDPAVIDRLLGGAEINLAVTSPPYADRRKYDESSGFRPVPPDAYVEWFAPVAANVADHLAADGSWLVNIKAGADELDTELYVLDLVIAHVREWGWHWATEFCWERAGVPKRPTLRLKGQFEPVYQFARGRWKFRPDNVRHASSDAIVPFGPGRGNTSWASPESAVVSQGQRGDLFEGQRMRKHARSRPGSIAESQGTGESYGQGRAVGWAYPGNRLPTFAGTHDATGHNAAFPVGLPAWFSRLFTDEGDVVFDPFTGSGSTLLAAAETGRVGYGVEISAEYCDIVLDRWIGRGGDAPVKLAR